MEASQYLASFRLVTSQLTDLEFEMVLVVLVHCLLWRLLASFFPVELLLYISPRDVCSISLLQ